MHRRTNVYMASGRECLRGIILVIVFKIFLKPDGSLVATLDSPDQGAKNIPVNKVTLEKEHLILVMRKLLPLLSFPRTDCVIIVV